MSTRAASLARSAPSPDGRPYRLDMPTIFLSSTIRDMGDLRSAMKYWLEQQGFVVFASESPDFPHALDRETVAAALAPIDDCDYYVLVVGARVGALVRDEGISVTRAEFRHACERRRKTGRPHMLHLVRREIYDARRTGRPAVVSEEEWPAIQDFLDEIAKQGESGDPNWLRSFDTFGEVVDVLRATLHVSGPLVRRALEANLQWELTTNTRELLGRNKNTIRPHALVYPDDLTLPSGVADTVRIEPREAYWMFLFRLSLRASLGRSALDECINSGHFLEYDVTTHAFVVGPLQRSLLELRRQIESLEGVVGTINSDETIKADITALADGARQKREAEVSEFTVRFLYAAWSATMNVLRLNRALYQVLAGVPATIEVPKLTPAYAPDEESKMSEEEISEQDASDWLRSAEWRVSRDEEIAAS